MLYLEKVVPLLCGLLSLLVFSPFSLHPLPISTIVFIHLLSYLGLGICFELPELTLNALCLYWAWDEGRFIAKASLIDEILKVRYILTHYVGPCTGISTIASGLYLTYRGGYSFQEGWLFWILAAATIGLYKGMYQHNSYLKNLFNISRAPDRANTIKLRRGILNLFDQSLIFLEFPTYVFIYWAASAKPWFYNPFADWISRFERIGSSWTAGVMIVSLGSLVLIPLRWGIRRFSSISVMIREQN